MFVYQISQRALSKVHDKTLFCPMVTYIDTHAHLYDEKYGNEASEVINASIAANVSRIYMPNLSLATIKPMLSLVRKHPCCKPMLGLHPCEIKENYVQLLDKIEPWFSTYPFVAVGEVGIDLYWDTTFYKAQVAALHTFIDWALKHDLPLILHARNSLPEVIQILKDRQNGHLRGILHCFSGTLTQAQEAIRLGFLLGIGGVLTFSSSKLPQLVKAVDIDYLVLETDAPYLAPTPHRGKRNQPAYLPLIAEKLATIKEVSVEEVAQTTTTNALRVFQEK